MKPDDNNDIWLSKKHLHSKIISYNSSENPRYDFISYIPDIDLLPENKTWLSGWNINISPLKMIEMEIDTELKGKDLYVLDKFKLSKQQHDIMFLRYWLEMSPNKIAKMLGISRRSVRVQIERSITKINLKLDN